MSTDSDSYYKKDQKRFSGCFNCGKDGH